MGRKHRKGQAEVIAALSIAMLTALSVYVAAYVIQLQRRQVAEAQEYSQLIVERMNEFVAFRLADESVEASSNTDSWLAYRAMVDGDGSVLWKNFTAVSVSGDWLPVFKATWTEGGDVIAGKVRTCDARLVAVTGMGRLFSWCPQALQALLNPIDPTQGSGLGIYVTGGTYYAFKRIGNYNYSVRYVYRGGAFTNESVVTYVWDANMSYNIFKADYDGYVVVKPVKTALSTLQTAHFFSVPDPSIPYATPSWSSVMRADLAKKAEINRTIVYDGSRVSVTACWRLDPVVAAASRSTASSTGGGSTYSVYFTIYNMPSEWSLPNIIAALTGSYIWVQTPSWLEYVKAGYAYYSHTCQDQYCGAVSITAYSISSITCGGSNPCYSGGRVYAYWRTGTTPYTFSYTAYLSSVMQVGTEYRFSINPTLNPTYYRVTQTVRTASPTTINSLPANAIATDSGATIYVVNVIPQMLQAIG
ncbi:MAG: hypothetical protein QW116_01460 [Zestosphaera sp.]